MMRTSLRAMVVVSCLAGVPVQRAAAQQPERLFAGALFGVSTLSADGRSNVSASAAALSLYKPENGWAVNVFAGVHLARYFSVQGNYMWNGNDVTLVSSVADPGGGRFYEQRRQSAQHAFVADTLLYFRPTGSVVRPYLGTGLAIVRFSSAEVVESLSSGLPPPAGNITGTEIGLRSHVGIDISLRQGLAFRYSFSETISGNPISPHLTPPGERRLANFENLFGLVARF